MDIVVLDCGLKVMPPEGCPNTNPTAWSLCGCGSDGQDYIPVPKDYSYVSCDMMLTCHIATGPERACCGTLIIIREA